MKKLKLRKEVKDALKVALGVILIAALILLDNAYTKDAIDKCVKNGNSYAMCERELG